MKERHLGKTPYQHGECQRCYNSSQSLKIHMKKHAEPGQESQQFACKDCGKAFPTIGKLNQHSEKHQDIWCEYCNKSFAYMCTMKAHTAESCPEHPGKLLILQILTNLLYQLEQHKSSSGDVGNALSFWYPS